MSFRPDGLTFASYLQSLPPETVFGLSPGEPTRRIISSTLISSIYEIYAAPGAFSARLMTLPEELRPLILTAYLYGSVGIPAEGLLPDQRNPLIKSLLVALVQTSDRGIRLVPFADIAERCGTEIADITARLWQKEPLASPPRLATAPVSDLALVAARILIEPCEVNAACEPSKQTVNALKKVLHFPVAAPILGDYRDSRIILTFLVDFAQSEGIFSCIDGHLTANRAAIVACLARPAKEIMAAMYRHLMGRLVALDEKAVMALATSLAESSFSIPVITKNRFEALCAEMILLTWIGHLDGTGDNGPRFSASQSERFDHAEAASIVVLSDFSAILPQEAPPTTIFNYALAAEVTSLDKVYRGTINKQTVVAALCAGRTVAETTAFLEAANAPANVKTTAAEWIREFARVSLIDGAMLAIADDRTASQLTAIATLSEMIEEVSAVRFFRIRPGMENAVRVTLAQLGFDPRVPAQPVVSSPAAHLPTVTSPTTQTIVTDIFRDQRETPLTVSGGKYSADLKELELNDRFHVIDYAILMGHQLRVVSEELKNSEANPVVIEPVKQEKGVEPWLDAKKADGKACRLSIKKLAKIGVVYD